MRRVWGEAHRRGGTWNQLFQGRLHAMLEKRAQGRPARGIATVGPHKIVEGMQDALRALQSNIITRKDIARFAGVTPALVTYYFPERNTLVEAATAPIVEKLATSIQKWISEDIEMDGILMNVIIEVLSCYSKDIAILELYVSHRRSIDQQRSNDGLEQISSLITVFFDRWFSSSRFSSCTQHGHDGAFMTNALLGICRSVAYNQLSRYCLSSSQDEKAKLIKSHAEMIYDVIIAALPRTAVVDAC